GLNLLRRKREEPRSKSRVCGHFSRIVLSAETRRQRKSSFSDTCASWTGGAQLRSIIIASCKASEIRFISVKSRCDGQISETYRDRGVCCSGHCCVFATSLWVMNPDAYFPLVQG